MPAYETTTTRIDCPYCDSQKVVRWGKQVGKQRYKCRGCDKTFINTGALHGFRIPADTIGMAIGLFYSGLSYKQIGENLASNKDMPEPSKRTIYEWVKTYTDMAADVMQDHKAETSGHWVADESTVDVGGEQFWNWNVMDSETRYILASHLSPFRDRTAAAATMRKAKLAASEPPKTIKTDSLPAYNAAIKEVFPKARHIHSKGMQSPILNNNMSERLQGTFRQRTKTLRGLEGLKSGQRYLDGWVLNYNLFREHEGLGFKTPGEAAKVNAPFKEWADIVKRIPATAPMPRVTRDRLHEQRDVEMKDRPGVTFLSSSKRNRQVLNVPASIPKKRKRRTAVAAGKVVR